MTVDFAGLMELWVDGSGYVEVTSPEQWAVKRTVMLDVLFDFLLPHPEELQPPDLTLVSEEQEEGYVRKTVEYSTLPGERVRAYLLIPDGVALPAPAVLALHQTTCSGKREVVGLGGDRTLAYGLDLVRRGYVVLAPDGITFGERVAGAPCGDTRAVYRKFPHWSALGIMTWEAMQAVNVLFSLPEVDTSRVGCLGHSHGGYGTILLAAVDERIKASVSSCGFMGMCDDAEPVRWARDAGFVFMPELGPYIKKRVFPFDFHELLALVAPRPFMNISAENDAIFPGSAESSERACAEVEQVYERIYGEERVFKNLTHPFGHKFPTPVKVRAYNWLDSWLKGVGDGRRQREDGEGDWVGTNESAQETAPHTGAPEPSCVGAGPVSHGAVRFSMSGRSRVTLVIYDVYGRKVRSLADGEFGPGELEFAWDCKADDGTAVRPGVYFYRAVSPDAIRTGKTLVLR
ncbi:MAG: acetylxylan esterase [Candidatus Eisenbacteria bacterium]|nr:acetylxylan esterase [Candidatus Eisenbacteria bacterium]